MKEKQLEKKDKAMNFMESWEGYIESIEKVKRREKNFYQIIISKNISKKTKYTIGFHRNQCVESIFSIKAPSQK